MKINFELTFKDLDSSYKETFFMKRFFIIFLKEALIKSLSTTIIASTIIITIFIWAKVNYNILFILPLFGGLLFLSGLYSYFGDAIRVYRIIKDTDRNYEVNIDDDDCIKITRNDSETVYFWSKIKAIENTKSSILIYISDRQAIIIPKRIFESEQEINNFWNEVKNKYNSIPKE